MNSDTAKINQSLTTAEEMRNQTKLIMQPYANWEEYLTPAPLSIAILGELVYISSKDDFSINKNPPEDGYRYIRYPDSFCACLMQVCNSSWWAFNEAHKNMDQIRLLTMTVPDYMKTAVKILFHGNDEVVQAHLPDQLDNIRVIADKCLELADATEKRFSDVIDIIRELLEACLYVKVKDTGFYPSMRKIHVLLARGMDAMGRVKEQWEKMVCFFQMVSSIVKTSLNRTMKDFVSTSEKMQTFSYNAKLFSKDLLYNQAFQSTNISNLVHMISATYTDVSTKHIMDRVSSLGKLMTMDKDKPEFVLERLQLQESCDQGQRDILKLVLKNKKEFERKSRARLEKVDKELLDILPAAAPDETKSMEAAVQSGFTEEDADYI